VPAGGFFFVEGRGMRKISYRYSFITSVPIEQADELLEFAEEGAESLFGESLARMDARSHFCLARRICVIDCDTRVGRAINLLFIGSITRAFGEGSFTVDRVPSSPDGPRAIVEDVA
jgi:hypothetical protein